MLANVPTASFRGCRHSSVKIALMALGIGLVLSSPTIAEEDLTAFIKPIPKTIDYSKPKAELGRKLFFETAISANKSMSCASCHFMTKRGAGVDRLPLSVGVNGKETKRNTPTVYNSVFNFRQNWDGKFDNLKDHAKAPLLNPSVMGMSDMQDVVEVLESLPGYQETFQQVYGVGITAGAIQTSLAEFQKSLITPNGPFDRYIQGDSTAISEQAKRGYQKFKNYGCVSCHQGVNVGGNLFQKFGVLKDTSLRNINDTDLGRYEITKNEWDKRVFRVPSLRLAALTPPYFHDGSAATLDEAVNTMIIYQLGRDFDVPAADRKDIIEFLKTLPGEIEEYR